jgi:NitT/TauT family transport system permease protein
MTSTIVPATPDATMAASPQGSRRLPAPLRLDGSITPRQAAVAAVLGFVLLLLVWTGFAVSGVLSEALLPSPLAVAARIGEQISNGELFTDIGISSLRIFGAFGLASVMAVPLGILMARMRLAESLLLPLTEFVRYLPVVAFLPLSIVWFGADETQKLFIIWMGTFFSLVLMVVDDTRRVPREFVEVGRTFGMHDLRLYVRVVFPAALPGIWDSLRLAMGWCWTWLLVSEIVAAESGLGYRINLAKRFLDTDLIIGYIIVLGVLGLIIDQAFRLAGRRLFSYQRKGRS